MSRHLSVLRWAGLVVEPASDTDRRERLYHLAQARLTSVRAWVEEHEGLWSDQLGGFATHVAKGTKSRTKT